MSETLDTILFDLSECLSEEAHAELVERIALATELATAEVILRMSFKSPDGGSRFRERVFKAKRQQSTKGIEHGRQ